jgi:phage tail sheath protein FI
MPQPLTYPGVYVEEVPSGVRTIVGVATSITAFVGTAAEGRVNWPVTLHSFADYERQFGGLSAASTLGYAVLDFFRNGGGEALIVRLVAEDAKAATLTVDSGGNALPLVAASEGAWGNALAATVDYKTRDADSDSPDTKLFNLTITAGPGVTQRYLNVSVADDDPRYVARVLADSSSLVHVKRDDDGEWIVPEARPAEGESTADADSGADGGTPTDEDYKGSQANKTGIFALESADLFNLLSIPPPTRDGATSADVYATALAYCQSRRAVLLVDPAPDWTKDNVLQKVSDLALTGEAARFAAVYFPRVLETDDERDGQIASFVPSGAVAGIIARTDGTRGVWKAPAGIDASFIGVRGLEIPLTDDENGDLNPLAVNCLRTFPVFGSVVWGARTMRGADQVADEYKYLPVRRLALFLEESLYRGLKWVVFEPNDEPLWSQIRLNVGAFMQGLFRQGAFQGKTPADAYFVACDGTTTTQNDINLGIVNIIVGFAPLKPAEFVVLRIQQMAGQIET